MSGALLATVHTCVQQLIHTHMYVYIYIHIYIHIYEYVYVDAIDGCRRLQLRFSTIKPPDTVALAGQGSCNDESLVAAGFSHLLVAGGFPMNLHNKQGNRQ